LFRRSIDSEPQSSHHTNTHTEKQTNTTTTSNLSTSLQKENKQMPHSPSKHDGKKKRE